MFDVKVFIVELLAVDRFSSCAVEGSKVAALNHERFDDAMKD
jgi:hypothetical protein